MAQKALMRIMIEGLESQETGESRRLGLLNPVIKKRGHVYITGLNLCIILYW
jgi:hypothetical protein